MPIIDVKDMCKSFRVSATEPGFVNALRHFFRRKYRIVEAVKPLSFTIEPGEMVGFKLRRQGTAVDTSVRIGKRPPLRRAGE